MTTDDSIQHFLSSETTSLKICGITLAKEAHRLVEMGVDAIGINFWPKSKRYLSPDTARQFLPELAGKIVRVGVFVNEDPALPRQLIEQGVIDLAQFHGDETPEYCYYNFGSQNIPFIKAFGVHDASSLNHIECFQATSVLLDTPAPDVYGGTGEKFDWTHARDFINSHPNIPVLLAGGITPDNAADAIAMVHPAALDVASGAEISPGIKDFNKVRALLDACSKSRKP